MKSRVRDDFSCDLLAIDDAPRKVVSDPTFHSPMTHDESLFQYLLRLGDSPLIFAQRLGEWIGHGPILEEDIAQGNVGLDLLGQARLWLGYAGEVEARYALAGRNEDQLAFLRDSADFCNLLLAEQPNGSFADTIARQFLFDAWHVLLLSALSRSSDARITGMAAKAGKEGSYHVGRSADWVVTLRGGTGESRARTRAPGASALSACLIPARHFSKWARLRPTISTTAKRRPAA